MRKKNSEDKNQIGILFGKSSKIKKIVIKSFISNGCL